MVMFKFKSNEKIIICNNIPYLTTDHNNVVGTMIRGDKVLDIMITECDSENEAEELLTEIFNVIESNALCGNTIATVDVTDLLQRKRRKRSGKIY